MNKYKIFILVDIAAVILSLYFAILLKFDFSVSIATKDTFLLSLPIFVVIQIIVFYLHGLYNRLWRYTSLYDLYAILSAVAISSGISFICIIFAMNAANYPRSVLILYLIINVLITTSTRLVVRVYYSHYYKDLKSNNNKKLLLLIGAGKTGDKIARQILASTNYSIVGFVDDDPNKEGALLHGKKIFCGVSSLPNLNIRYDELLITAPTATGDQMRRIVKVCKQTGKKYKTVPAINEIIDGEISLSVIRDVSYADLLGREEVILDMNSIENLIQGKRVLITGAGGSIGSELVRQCLAFNPAEIICLDMNEEKIYSLDQFSSKNNSPTILKTILASITNKNELTKVFSDNRPHIVFHAAAYKHVPIQELHPWTAVNTNLGGTLNMVELSDRFSVNKFVLVSTDKAVNPVNVMGATKRAAEKLIQSFNLTSKTTYMAVRFGNVLGSSGSAIPTFQKQINSGGPITITHPEMKRYFMSIQEASLLILQCGSIGRDGEIFLLEMGKPIKITQMVNDLIRLSGLEPEIDIPIVFTGLRPGEKLYEELQMYDEKKVKTSHNKIMILKDSQTMVAWHIFNEGIQELLNAAKELNSEKIQLLLKQILPTYRPRTFESNVVDQRTIFHSIKGQA